MCSQSNNAQNPHADYEVAGSHPMPDLAISFYIDVFFETLYLYLKLGATTGSVDCRSTGNTSVANFAPPVDLISQAVLDIRLQYLTQPPLLHGAKGESR
jgi:hypothetical protein